VAETNEVIGQWPHVAQNWLHIGAPLRPGAEDIGFFQSALDDWCAAHTNLRPHGLILGVTPELYNLAWPDHNLLLGSDRTSEMIDYVWPGKKENVLNADWRSIDLPAASIDMALCDGGLHLLNYPQGQRELAERMASVIRPGGRFAVRLFLPSEDRETPDEVLAALNAGQIRDLNCLKLRVGPALMPSPEAGVCLHDVWLKIRSQSNNGWEELANRLGWPLEKLSIIDSYYRSDARYHFVTLQQAIDVFTSVSSGSFVVDRIDYPKYEMGEQCPTLVLIRR
jgi:SAM-dependent methyltransferase